MPIYFGNKKVKLYLGNKAVKALYLGNKKVYPSGSTVTYRVDSGITYTEEVDEGASCLSPKTFTPTKSGWVFVGWRSDSTANGSVLSSKVMGDAPITLYAVFRQTITLSYNGNSATSGSTVAQTGYRYYNNGNTVNPSFTLAANGFAKSGYTFSKWALGSTGGTQYAAGASVALSANTTMYAVWTYTGTPFYLVQGTVTKQTLTWTMTDGYNNANIITNRWNIGDSYPSVSGDYNNYYQQSWFKASSNTFSTKGNKSIRISFGGSTAGQKVWINGVEKTSGSTWDISGLETIRIDVQAERYDQAQNAWIQFSEIYLF